MNRIVFPLAISRLVLILAAFSSSSGTADRPRELNRQTGMEYQHRAYHGVQYQLSMLQNPTEFQVESV